MLLLKLISEFIDRVKFTLPKFETNQRDNRGQLCRITEGSSRDLRSSSVYRVWIMTGQ